MTPTFRPSRRVLLRAAAAVAAVGSGATRAQAWPNKEIQARYCSSYRSNSNYCCHHFVSSCF